MVIRRPILLGRMKLWKDRGLTFEAVPSLFRTSSMKKARLISSVPSIFFVAEAERFEPSHQVNPDLTV